MPGFVSYFKEQKSFKWAILLSLVVHMFFFTKNINMPLVKRKKNVSLNPKTMKLIIKKSTNKKMQIVNTQIIKNKEKPIDAKFLSKLNQKFDRQTAARTIGKFKEAGFGSKNVNNTRPNKVISKTKPKRKANKKISKVNRKKLNKELKKKISLGDLSIAKHIPSIKDPQVQKDKGLRSGSKGKRGLASNNDFIEDVPLGDVTHLNTIEFKYYGFYFRVRQKLEQYWGNTLKAKAKKLFKRGRSIASDENHITSLKITLDNRGNIVDIYVLGTSGVTELDEAAVESFNKAGPFPNPPKGMLSGGKAQIEWGFVVKS